LGPAGGQPFEKVAKHGKKRFYKHPLKTSLPRFLKAGRRKALIINSSDSLNHSPSPILHGIPLRRFKKTTWGKFLVTRSDAELMEKNRERTKRVFRHLDESLLTS
jgi:hypothetical protein